MTIGDPWLWARVGPWRYDRVNREWVCGSRTADQVSICWEDGVALLDLEVDGEKFTRVEVLADYARMATLDELFWHREPP